MHLQFSRLPSSASAPNWRLWNRRSIKRLRYRARVVPHPQKQPKRNHILGKHDHAVDWIQKTVSASRLLECENVTCMRSLDAGSTPRSVQFPIQLTSAFFKRLWPSIVKNYHFGYFWHTLTHTLCSIKSTCCIASLSIKRSCSSRHGFTGKSYRALSRSRSVRVNDGAHRITEAHIFDKSCYPLTSEKRVYYIATVIMWNGPS